MPSAKAGDLRVELATNIAKFSSEMSRAGKSVSTFSRGSIASLNLLKVGSAAVLAGMTALTGGVVALAKRGERLASVESSFRSLTMAINESADAMLSTTREATKGLISDLEIMEAANKGLLLGLPLTEDSMGQLAETAAVLGRAMGQDATKSLDDLITALGRSSPLILDNLGLTVKVGEANEAYARALGKSASELTESEKKTAFYNAAMDAAAVKVEELGGVQLTLGDRLSQVSTQFTNFLDQLSIAIGRSPVFNAALQALQEAFTMAFGDDTSKMVEMVVGWLEQGVIATAAIADAAITAAQKVADFSIRVLELADSFVALQQRIPKALLPESIEENLESARSGIQERIDGIRKFSQGMESARSVVTRFSERIQNAEASTQIFTERVKESRGPVNSAGDAANEAAKHVSALAKAMEDANNMGAAFSSINARLSGQVLPETVTQFRAAEIATAKLGAEISNQAQPINGLIIGLQGARVAVEDLREQLDPPGGFFSGFTSSFQSLLQGMTSGAGIQGLFNNIGLGIAEGFGNIISGGMTTLINAGVNLAVQGLTALGGKIGSFFKGLFGGPSEAELEGRAAFEAYRDAAVSGLSEGQIAEAAAAGWANPDDAALFIMIRDTFAEIGRSEAEAEAIWNRLVDAIKTGPEAIAAVVQEINAAVAESENVKEETQAVTDEVTELDQAGEGVSTTLEETPWSAWEQEGTKAAMALKKAMQELAKSIPSLPKSSKSGTQEIPKLGRGGIVTSPTLAIVGDVPEAITPLAGPSFGGQFLDVSGVERRLDQLDTDVLQMANKFAVAMASVLEERV